MARASRPRFRRRLDDDELIKAGAADRQRGSGWRCPSMARRASIAELLHTDHRAATGVDELVSHLSNGSRILPEMLVEVSLRRRVRHRCQPPVAPVRPPLVAL
jgi:hypothetical protein